MSVVQLSIVAPANGACFVGAAPVTLKGSVATGAHRPLFHRWYSSLNATLQPNNDSALNGAPYDQLTFAAALKVGSHVITFAAKDVAGEKVADILAVQDAGMTGGPQPPAPCIVHVFIANLISPAAGATLSKAASTLEAEAPVKWGAAEYAAVNRVRYRYRFAPSGPPAGRPSADLLPTEAALQLDTSSAVPKVHFQGALPASLGTGNYTLTLRVEDKNAPDAVGHEASVPVVINP